MDNEETVRGVLRCLKTQTKLSAMLVLMLPWACVSASTFDGLTDSFDNGYENPDKPWQEIAVSLPAAPSDDQLISFQVGSRDDMKFFIDGASLSVGSDEVIRYTLVIDSASGARNISYEGMRCKTGERRVYAFGRSDGSWSKARSNQWKVIQGGSNDYRVDLFSNFFCTVGVPAIRSADDARSVLRRGGSTAGLRP